MYDVSEDLAEIFEFMAHKLRKGGCTMEEINGAMKAVEEHVPIHAELEDIAEFYGQSKTAVSSQIKRNMYDKPRKNVTLYSFPKILRIIPEKWRKKR